MLFFQCFDCPKSSKFHFSPKNPKFFQIFRFFQRNAESFKIPDLLKKFKQILFQEPFDNDMEEDDIIEEDDDVIEEDDVIDSENDYEGNVDLDVVEALAALPSSLSNHPTSTRSPNGVNGGRASATPKLSTTDSAFSSNQDVSSRRASTHSNPIPIPNFVNALPIVNNDPKEFRGRRQTIGTRVR